MFLLNMGSTWFYSLFEDWHTVRLDQHHEDLIVSHKEQCWINTYTSSLLLISRLLKICSISNCSPKQPSWNNRKCPPTNEWMWVIEQAQLGRHQASNLRKCCMIQHIVSWGGASEWRNTCAWYWGEQVSIPATGKLPTLMPYSKRNPAHQFNGGHADPLGTLTLFLHLWRASCGFIKCIYNHNSSERYLHHMSL